MVSLILVSTILLVTITASANLFRDQSAQHESVRVHELLGVFLDEVAVRDFRDPDANRAFGLEDDEMASDRMTFDDVDDYDQYTVTPPTFHDNATIGGFDGWTVQVSVQRATPSANGLTFTADDVSPLRLVTVTATGASGIPISESILISEINSDLAPNTTHDRLRRLNLSFSADRQVTVSVPLINQPGAN